jgi:serine/threonine-protein kinase MRCK
MNELLLVFRELGVYVNCSTGMRTRHRELMWTALPISTGFAEPNLLIFTEKSIDIYDVPSGIWLQSLPLARTRSLTSDGCICLSHDSELVNHHPKLLFLMPKNDPTPSLNVPERASSKSLATRAGRFRTGVVNHTGGIVHTMKSTTSTSIAPISGPKDFTHISHLGKGEGLQILSGLKQVSPTNTLASTSPLTHTNSYTGSGGTLNNSNHRRSLISGPQNFVHLTLVNRRRRRRTKECALFI